MSLTGRILITVVGVLTSTGCFIADWNATHIYNPLWPPHAKFHNGQTMSMGLLLGLCTLYYLYRTPPSSSKPALGSKGRSPQVKTRAAQAYHEARLSDLNTAALLASLYWITQVSAFAYPDSLPFDTGDWNPLKAPQTYISATCLALTALGWKLETAAVMG